MEQEKNKGEARETMGDMVRNAGRRMTDPVLTPEKPHRAGDLIPVTFDHVQDLNIDWLWEPYIQRGNLTILRADPGTGKTFFVAALMAAIANGYQPAGMPGELKKTCGRCIYFGNEDDPETIKTRIKSAGGVNLSQLAFIREPVTFGEPDRIRKAVEDFGADLIVFDTIQSYLGSKVNMNSANEIAPLLDSLREVARKTDAAILITEHKNKNEKGSALYRGIGSMSIVGAARSVLEIVRDPDARNIRYTMQLKTNHREAAAAMWAITENGKFEWKGKTEKTQDEINETAELASVPIIMAAREIMDKHPDGWQGSASDIQKECGDIPGFNSYAIGRALNDSIALYQLRTLFGVYVVKKKVNGKAQYHIYQKTEESTDTI